MFGWLTGVLDQVTFKIALGDKKTIGSHYGNLASGCLTAAQTAVGLRGSSLNPKS